MKKTFLVFFVFILAIAPKLYGEQITLTTYYPSPIGIYDHVKLAPREAMENDCRLGTIYSFKGDHNLYYCNGAQEENEKGMWSQIVLIGSIRELEQKLNVVNIRVDDTDAKLQVFMMDTDAAFRALVEEFGDFKDAYDRGVADLEKKINKLQKDRDRDFKTLQAQIDSLKRVINSLR